MTLSPSDLDRLEELAKAATSGKREFEPLPSPEMSDQASLVTFEDGTLLIETESGAYPLEMSDALFVAACDRETILSLVSMARRAPRWIPVEERLPESGAEVIVEAFGARRRALLVAAVYCGERGWRGDCDGPIDGVARWTPLPEPPEPR